MRAKIINELKNKPMNAHQLKDLLKIDYKTARHHLRLLQKNSFIHDGGTDKYGTLYFLTESFVFHMPLFEEIWGKINKDNLGWIKMGIMNITLGLAIFNIIILVYLAFLHLSHFKRFKSGFTLGLFLFIIVFLIQNITATYFYLTMMKFYADGLELAAFLITSIETIAFLVFTWIARR